MFRIGIYGFIIYEKLCNYILQCNTDVRFHKFKEALIYVVNDMHKYDPPQYDHILSYVKNLDIKSAELAVLHEDANLSNLCKSLLSTAAAKAEFMKNLKAFFQMDFDYIYDA